MAEKTEEVISQASLMRKAKYREILKSARGRLEILGEPRRYPLTGSTISVDYAWRVLMDTAIELVGVE